MALEVEKQKEEKKERDVRIEEASAISDLLKHSGYKILLKYYNDIRDKAHSEVFDEKFSDETLSGRRDIYNQIQEWIKIPSNIIKDGEQAIIEKSQEDERPSTEVKDSNTPYLGSKY